MLQSRKGRIMVGLLVLTLAVAAIMAVVGKPRTASAQIPPGMADEVAPPEMNPPPQPGMYPGTGPAPGPERPNRMMPDRGWTMPITRISSGGQAAIAASGEYVYVVQGNTLYQFSARTLKQLNKAELASTTPERPVLPMGGGTAAPMPER